jgi:hypothetical protein
VFASAGQEFFEQAVEAERLPESMSEPDVAEASAAFEAKSAEIERYRLGGQVVVEEAGLPL